MNIPTPALDNFLLAVEEAAALALQGERAAGYECLLVGRQRVLEAGQDRSVPLAVVPPAAWQ